ncbi:Mitochondrial distribution and morphology protein 10 [Malassezia obtusa]|uniref:Mitochondrial distribution and morphology protein 10 n=1 Tax=Malassezia obtusa TaxID=76774 RepID=A0AAF0E0H4_9BASI|nr:Mitochondrial distribution and morphology protein 10 [Malassezia obtusa]
MYDAATVLLREYYRVTGWNEQQSYAHLMGAASALVDFGVPNGVLLSSASARLPTLISSARLLTVPLSGALGYTHVATHEPFDTQCVQRVERRMSWGAQFLTPDHPPGLLAARRDALGDGTLWDALRRRAPPRDMLLYGCFHVPTTYVEAMLVTRVAPHWQLLVTALSNAPNFPLVPLGRRLGLVAPGMPEAPAVVPPGATNLQFTLQMQTEKTTAEYSYSVDDALWGVRVLRSLTPPAALADGTLSAGGEVFVSAAEKSAGSMYLLLTPVSLGLRYALPPTLDAAGRVRTRPAVSSATLNPMMGHVRYAYAAQVEDDLTLCARYDLNVYSYLSDLTLGAEYCLGAPSDEEVERVEAPTTSLRERLGVWTPAPDAALSLREEGPAARSERRDVPAGEVRAASEVHSAVVPAAGPPASPATSSWSEASPPTAVAASAAPVVATEVPAGPTRAPAPEGAPRASAEPVAPEIAAPVESAVSTYRPTSPLHGLLKLRMSASGLFALLWEGRWNRCLVSVGLQTHVSMHPKLAAASTLGAEIVFVD